jgi:hypothetical protein
MQRADLQLLVNQRKPACVLDPALVLCQPRGPLLATRLTQVMEPWLTRSFWQALDSSELLTRGAPVGDAGVSNAALSAWIAMREGTELGASLFRWIGDRMPESLMQESGDLLTFERYELLAQALAQRSEGRAPPAGWCLRFDAEAASRDVLALSATLDGALVLCEGRDEPWPVRAAIAAGLPVTQLQPTLDTSLFAAEHVLVRQGLAAAGLAPILSGGAPLAVLHVLAGDDDGATSDELPDPWRHASACWYLL